MTRNTALDGHLGRILVLIQSFAAAKVPAVDTQLVVDGDFLVRYPLQLRRVAAASGVAVELGAWLGHIEHLAIGSQVARFKYSGDLSQHQVLLGALLGMRLLQTTRQGLKPTPAGLSICTALTSLPVWAAIRQRTDLVATIATRPGKSMNEIVRETLPLRFITREDT
jgi:hypothetical protein